MLNEKITTYCAESEKLFADWKDIQGIVSPNSDNQTSINHKDNIFIRDGVVCPELWFAQDFRPLFLLKEAYGGEDDWDLAKNHLLLNKPIDKIWERVSGWIKGMLSTTKTSLPEFIKDDTETSRYNNEYLKKTAVINIKKSGGKSSSDYDEIGSYALFDKDRLKKQLELCDPTIIVCGYTSSYLETILDKEFRSPYNDNLFYHITLNGHDVIVIDFWHPANHYPDIMNHYGFLGVYQKALNSN